MAQHLGHNNRPIPSEAVLICEQIKSTFENHKASLKTQMQFDRLDPNIPSQKAVIDSYYRLEAKININCMQTMERFRETNLAFRTDGQDPFTPIFDEMFYNK